MREWNISWDGIDVLGVAPPLPPEHSYVPSTWMSRASKGVLHESDSSVLSENSESSHPAQRLAPPAHMIQSEYKLNVISQNSETARSAAYHELHCPHGDLLTFWRRETEADLQFVSPFLHTGPQDKYVTFEPGQ